MDQLNELVQRLQYIILGAEQILIDIDVIKSNGAWQKLTGADNEKEELPESDQDILDKLF